MRDYDIFFKGTYFGTAKDMPDNEADALDHILKELFAFKYFECDADDIHIEMIKVEELTIMQEAFIEAYSKNVAKVDDEEIIEYFRTGKRTYNTDHIEDNWLLWNSAIKWVSCNENF